MTKQAGQDTSDANQTVVQVGCTRKPANAAEIVAAATQNAGAGKTVVAWANNESSQLPADKQALTESLEKFNEIADTIQQIFASILGK
ncbi:MAG TPA: hypothetical protein VFZ00_15105 [Solirubrobacter sp.]|nr:hypothetical protein [Solirubrobacter sp.]